MAEPVRPDRRPGDAEADHVRFRRNQAGLLDALLATQPEASCDETFARVREELRSFAGIGTGAQPEGFVGQLRDYQRDGVGWMEFLRRFSFGGCLADDMGVGKTAQVLALLEARRDCAPRRLAVRRWWWCRNRWCSTGSRRRRALRRSLRVLDHTGLARDVHDVLRLRRGPDHLRHAAPRRRANSRISSSITCVLDEAQAIKNPGTESAKAARLLRGRNRLALSGTPVENHLGELWSIFEFLNPGMLGAASVFKLAGGAARNPSEETRRLLAHALRPFILRRTKEQVARELPPKIRADHLSAKWSPRSASSTTSCASTTATRCCRRVAAQGLAKSKIQVLEALLRLRQAACHPALIDPKRRQRLQRQAGCADRTAGRGVGGGPQGAGLLRNSPACWRMVQERLDESRHRLRIPGRGRRATGRQRVERFQNDPDCKLFLISLKAGGLGLNLTAAEYVFLLDPWWNPAVEAQAVDRAHRIGQTHQVFAYRLIARDTVEEKMLQLQKHQARSGGRDYQRRQQLDPRS